MYDPKVQDLLKIKMEAKSRIAELRQETLTKVMRLRTQQKLRPNTMSFADKMAYFTTARVQIEGADISETTSSTREDLKSIHDVSEDDTSV